MGDLEDALLKKNVPGRYSAWDDERERRAGGEDDGSDGDDDAYYFDGLPAAAPHAEPLPPLRSSGNTGVKGVLADYRDAQQDERLRREEERLENLRIFQHNTHRNTRDVEKRNVNDEDEASEDDASSLDDGDEDFLKRFRNQRLAQLQQEHSEASSSSAIAQTPPPTFSSLTAVSPEDYVRLVDDLDPRVFLVVHLYEPSLTQCRMLHATLEKVAQRMEWANFVEVQALEASPTLDTICLPALLVYQQGELVHNLVRFTEFEAEDAMDALEALGVADASRSRTDGTGGSMQ